MSQQMSCFANQKCLRKIFSSKPNLNNVWIKVLLWTKYAYLSKKKIAVHVNPNIWTCTKALLWNQNVCGPVLLQNQMSGDPKGLSFKPKCLNKVLLQNVACFEFKTNMSQGKFSLKPKCLNESHQPPKIFDKKSCF